MNPKKNRIMTVLYKPFQSTVVDPSSGKKLFYPRVVRTGNVGSDKLAQEVAEYSSLTSGDVKNTIDNLVTVMTLHLQSSESVTLDGLGTFHMTMHSRGRGVETADEVSSSQATLTVRFQPATTKNADRTVATRSLVTGSKCVRSDKVFTSASTSGSGSGSGGDGGDGDGGETPNPSN